MEEELAILAQLKKEVPGVFELYHKTTFVGYRRTKTGATQELTIDVLDAGPDKPELRYSIEARTEDGKTAGGNPGPAIDIVIATVHWYDLDK